MKNPIVLRTEKEGVEYFTIALTGESGMSQRGLARACGVTHPSIIKLESNLVTKSPSKWLEPFVGKELNLVTDYSKNGGSVTVYTAEFCAAVIQHYAFKGKETAQKTLSATTTIGLTSYIQSQTGWLPEQFKAAPKAQDELSRILDAPDPWQKFFEKAFCDRICKVYSTQFYWKVVYAVLTPQEYYKLQELNPKRQGRGRLHCIHQFIEPETKERMKPYLREARALLNAAENRQQFDDGYLRQFGINLDRRYRQLLEDYFSLIGEIVAERQQSAV